MGHIIVSAGYMAAALMPSGLAPNESFLVAFLVSWAFAAFASSVMILVFLMAVGRHWRIDYSPVADSDRRRSIQYSTYYGLKMLLVVAILIVFFAKMASWKTHDIGDALLMYAYTLFAILLTVILAVPSSLGAVSPLRGLCMVSVLAVFLGLMPFLAGHGWAPSFLSQYTVLTPVILMASLLSLRAHGIRLIYSSR